MLSGLLQNLKDALKIPDNAKKKKKLKNASSSFFSFQTPFHPIQLQRADNSREEFLKCFPTDKRFNLEKNRIK